MKNYSIILASGAGSRYGSDIPKQFAKIAGKTILEHTIEIFEKAKEIDEIFVIITPEYRHLAEEILVKNNLVTSILMSDCSIIWKDGKKVKEDQIFDLNYSQILALLNNCIMSFALSTACSTVSGMYSPCSYSFAKGVFLITSTGYILTILGFSFIKAFAVFISSSFVLSGSPIII